jgi:DNA-binding NtrC family response regulator
MPRQTLVTFTGAHDPYFREPHEDGWQRGPVLTVLAQRKYDHVVLLGRPHRQEELERTHAAVRERHPRTSVEVRPLELGDTTHHAEILAQLRPLLGDLRRARPDDSYTLSLLSCPPEIHASLVLIVAAGEFPARLLNLRRTVHGGLAGPSQLRELDWSEPLARLDAAKLAQLSSRRDRWDDAEQQGPGSLVPRHHFTVRAVEQALQLCQHDTPLLIRGEPGCQKQLYAALIHQLGPRQHGPLIIFNCATLPAALFAAVLFGEEGREADGKLHHADAGTLVLIKCQHIPPATFERLLQAVAEGQYYPAGRHRQPVRVNCRLIFTTDRDLDTEVRQRRFSAEAWRQLKLNTVTLPPLREHPADIALLAHDELERLNRTLPRPKRFSSGALAKLESHAWPSNISELRRVIEHAVVQSEQPTIQAGDIALDLALNMANVFNPAAPRIRAGFSLEDYLRSVKYELVRSVLRKTANNQSEAARLLGVTPQAVSKYMRALQPATRRRTRRAAQ